MNIYEGIRKACALLIIILTDITFRLVRQCNENVPESWMALIDKYTVLEKRKSSLNKVTNMWNTCRIKGISQDPEIRFNELYTLYFRFNKIKEI